MKRILISIFCLFALTSCVSSSAFNARNKEIAEATYREGQAYFAQERYSIALGKFLKAEKTIPDDRFLQYEIGYTYFLKNQYVLAEKHFKKALTLEPDFISATNALGVVYLEQKQWDHAITSFQICVDSLLYGTPHYALTNLGWAYLGKKNYNLAKNHFLKALKKVPHYSRALHGLTMASLATDSEYTAIARLEKALKAFPDSMIINYDLARIYEKLNKTIKAKKHWEKVLKTAPEESSFSEEAANRLKNY